MQDRGCRIKKSYRDLEIFALAKELAVMIHRLTLEELLFTYAIASGDETKAHLEMLHETGSLKKEVFEDLLHRYEELCAKLFNFREAVIKGHRTL